MRKLLVVALLAVSGCHDAVYRQADKLTYLSVGQDYRGYVEMDTSLSKESRARRLNALDTWGLRCGAIVMSGSVAVQGS